MLKKLVSHLPEPMRTKVRDLLGLPRPGHVTMAIRVKRADGTLEDIGVVGEAEVEFLPPKGI